MYRSLWPPISRSESGAIKREHPQYTKWSWYGHGAEPDLVLGHHQAVGADQVDVLLPLVVLDIFSRYAVGWMVADRENSALARSSHRRDLPQTGRPAPGAHPALRKRPMSREIVLAI